MIPVAKNLEEAKTFFLENSHGTILCQREDGVELAIDQSNVRPVEE